MCTGIVVIKPSDKAAAMEKEFHRKKRTRQIRQLKLDKDKNPALEAERSEGVNNDNGQEDVQNVLEEVPETKPKATRVLKRRRFHNFTPRVMAHEYLAYRRLDRFYHRATILARDRTFFKLGLTGDMFLNGQAPRIVGLFIALARGVIEPDFIDCIFDEDFPPLVPAPAAPTFALFAGEANYMLSEGKSKTILSPRNTKQYEHGFNDEKIILRVTEWEKVMHEAMADAWIRQGVDEDGRLAAERQWITQILEPWGINAQKQLIEYRQWKAASKLSPTLDSLEKSVPKIFDAVLYYLREASASGKWPSTTPKRQLVMVSTPQDEEACKNAAASLNIAYSKAKANKVDRSDAYGLEEGQGGASGSFSVGFMPGEQQPKSNELFPELTRAAFELERALMPEREPSSTIAINRNAQFRPHTDSGAGAGQSTSLIVGLGNYIGGELVVEGVKKDIHYKAIEFNGWTQRHWTMPFQGERYSLVWFTPKGCEGIRGIELCK
jgi:tRNA U38,U39,U40 pseudouridine synthase TruA